MTEQRWVTYRGIRMIEGWPEQIETAQLRPTIVLGTKEFSRIRYGNESHDWGADERPCHDCRVLKGEYRVPGCDVERCPACDGQLLTCDCEGDVG